VTSLTDIQGRLGEIECPVCKKKGYSINSQGDRSSVEIFYKALCTACRYTFPISVPTKPIQEVDPDLEQVLRGIFCPKCEERGVEFDFRCSASVRDAYHFVTCKNCKHAFHEKAPMEAYE